MVVLAVVIAIAVLGFAVGFGAVVRWPHADPIAPKLSGTAVRRAARLHGTTGRLLSARLDPHATTGLLLTAGAGAVVAVGLLWFLVRGGIGTASFDLGLSRWAAEQADRDVADVLLWLSAMGGTELMVAVGTLLVVAELVRIRNRAIVPFAILVLGGQSLLNLAIKALVDRARPDLAQLSGHWGASFPSGHAATAAATFATVALLLGRDRDRRARATLTGIAISATFVVAATRVLLGVHWLTDVLAGMALGWGWFALCSVAFGGRDLRFAAPIMAGQRLRRGVSPE